MKQPLVSIIVPAYNHEDYVDTCIDSLIKQTYMNIELIIINDGSSDRTNERILNWETRLEERFNRYIYINKQNEGINKTLNQAIRMSTGQYLKFFATDDYMYPQAIELLVSKLEALGDDYGVAYSDGYHVLSKNLDDGQDMYQENRRFSNVVKYSEGNLFEWYLDTPIGLPTMTFLYRKSCYERIGLLDENLLMDSWDLSIRLAYAFKFVCVDEVLFLHRIHDANTGRNKEWLNRLYGQLIKKYADFNLGEKENNKRLTMKFRRLMGGEEIFRGIKNNLTNKRVIGWGTGQFYREQQSIHQFDIEYLVDSNIEKHGTQNDSYLIFPVDRLLNENKSEIFVLVFSSYYREIYMWLDKHGFEFNKHYY
jgi:Glycosyltransferases, probably involved in cell wall biogenesis